MLAHLHASDDVGAPERSYLRVQINSLRWVMERHMRVAVEETVPWFMKNMPKAYFRQVRA